MKRSVIPRLPRAVQRQVNRMAAQRARAEVEAAWRRHQLALHAAALDLLTAGRTPADVLQELSDGAAAGPSRRS
ncbi:MAG TPA: hypothetical protein PKB14_07745 [Rubrivivax sp.]|nr:hypothetical protein [Rubrivivax sp.]